MSNFASLLRRADTLRRADPANSDWWAGYMRGLRRAHHGERFGTVAEHELWLSAAATPDPQRAALGRGYRAGLTLTMRDPDAYCPRCERFGPTIDDGETCARCKLVLPA